MKNLNNALLWKIPDNSGKFNYDFDTIMNNLSNSTKNFDIVKNNSGQLVFKQKNTQSTNTINLTFSDV